MIISPPPPILTAPCDAVVCKAEVLKERQKNTRDSIKEEEIRINAVEESNKRIEKNIKEIESRSRAWEKNKEDKIIELGEAIVKLEEIDISTEIDNHKVLSTLKEQQLKKKNLEQEHNRLQTSLNRSLEKLMNLKAI